MPNAGVGLARLEFIINNHIGVHPKAMLDYPEHGRRPEDRPSSACRTAMPSRAHSSPAKLAEGIATIAAAFWPKPVIVRLSDFKSNEYKKLIGGTRYEPDEENPMLGFRGASRYIAAELCRSASRSSARRCSRVRENMGYTNVEIMVPFVRTIKEARQVTHLLAEHGLKRGENGLRVIMMCELPSNALLAEEFLEFFDGFSIGSNDLTQLTLGLDRDSGMVADADSMNAIRPSRN